MQTSKIKEEQKENYSAEINSVVKYNLRAIRARMFFVETGPSRLEMLEELERLGKDIQFCSKTTQKEYKSVLKTSKDDLIGKGGRKYLISYGWAVQTFELPTALAMLGCDYVVLHTRRPRFVLPNDFLTICDKSLKIRLVNLGVKSGLPYKVQFVNRLPPFNYEGIWYKYVWTKDQNLLTDESSVGVGSGFFGLAKYGKTSPKPHTINGFVTKNTTGEYNVICLNLEPFPSYLPSVDAYDKRPLCGDEGLDQQQTNYFVDNVLTEQEYHQSKNFLFEQANNLFQVLKQETEGDSH